MDPAPVLRGVVRGNTIVLDDKPPFLDGSTVEVEVLFAEPPANWGDGLRRYAGAMAPYWTEQDDQILEQLYQDRKTDTRRDVTDD